MTPILKCCIRKCKRELGGDNINNTNERCESLNQFNLAYLLLSEPRWTGGKANNDPRTDTGFTQPLRNAEWIRKVYKGKIVGAGGFTPASAETALKDNAYDAIAFGRWFISK